MKKIHKNLYMRKTTDIIQDEITENRNQYFAVSDIL